LPKQAIELKTAYYITTKQILECGG